MVLRKASFYELGIRVYLVAPKKPVTVLDRLHVDETTRRKQMPFWKEVVNGASTIRELTTKAVCGNAS